MLKVQVYLIMLKDVLLPPNNSTLMKHANNQNLVISHEDSNTDSLHVFWL